MLLRMALFALMAVGLLGFGTVAWISTASAPPPQAPAEAAPIAVPPPPPVAKTMVVVASRALRAGGFVKADDLTLQPVAVDALPRGAAAGSPGALAQLAGAMLRHSLAEGQTVLPDDVLRPGDHGFLAAVLGNGMRAMTFNVSDVTTDWALIWPGDRVDLILTQQFDESHVDARYRIAAETIIRDARVVAVDRQLVQGETAEETEHKGTRTLTIELSPSDSEHLLVAERLGKITLALRSAAPVRTAGLADGAAAMADASGIIVPPTVTWGADVAHALDQTPPEATVVRVFRGTDDAKEFKF